MGNYKHTYKKSVDEVYAKLTDPEFLRRRSEASGHRNIDIQVNQRGEVLEIRITRDIESDIPSFAKRVVDPVNRVVDVIEWRDKGSSKAATYRVTVSKRISLRGETKLDAVDGRCVQMESFTATVDVPLIGRKIADIVERETTTAIASDCAFTANELGA